MMDMDGGEKRQLMVGNSYVEFVPVWTPDEGSRVVFQRTDIIQGNEAGIWNVAPDRTGLQQLSSVDAAVQVFAVR
jgi:hypothetical protein